MTTARDPEGRPTIFDELPPDLPRLVAVGRLDINTEGLMLLTNDGGLARVLELPATGWLRRYRVRAHGDIEQASLDPLADGVTIDGVDYAGIEATLDREQGSNAWITMGLREGKNREIKKVLEHLGLAVNRLIRVSFGPFELGDLAEGEVAGSAHARAARPTGREARQGGGRRFRRAADRSPRSAAARAGKRTAARRARAAREPAGPSERCRADLIVERRGARNDSKGTPRHAARPRRRRRPSAGASMSRRCAPKSPQTQRPRASGSSAARPTTARGGPSRSSACRGLAKRRTAARPKRGRNATARPNTGERGGRSFEGGARAGQERVFGPKRGRAAGGPDGRRVRAIRRVGRRPERSNAGKS